MRKGKGNNMRPNVLILYTDQQRKDSLSCYNPLAHTPNLDCLAESGARLDQYFVNAPVCMPSRMSMLSGKYCSGIGIGQNGYAYPKDENPLNGFVKPYGYDTAQIGKLHFKPHAKRNHKNPTEKYGFDTFILSDEPGCYDDAYTKWVEMKAPEQLDEVRTGLPPEAYHYNQPEYSTQGRETHEPYTFQAEGYHHSDFVTSEICDYIDNKAKQEQRFFAIAGFYAPHTPVNPPEKYLDFFDAKEMTLPKIGPENEVMDILKNLTDDDWKEIIRYYLALVSHVDDCVGKIVKRLKENGIYDETLILFTSDHGEFLGDYGRIQKGMPYDVILNVPCIISYPEAIKPNTKIDSLTEAVDVVPTILDFCGIQTPEYIQGKSMKPILTGETQEHKEEIFAEHFDHKELHISLIRTKDYKYVIWSDGSETLYDLNKDKDEFNDVSKQEEYKVIISDMRYRMLKKIRSVTPKERDMEAAY